MKNDGFTICVGVVLIKTMISQLVLVYPPFTNQEGVWLWGDEEVRGYVKESKLYMIVQRAELKFVDYQFIPDEFGKIRFRLKMGEIISPFINLSLKRVFEHLSINENDLIMELGDKLFRVKDEGSGDVILWCTPDVFLFKMWRLQFDVKTEAPFDFRIFTKFKLHYVGISKKNDSFTRLFGKPHHGRLNILSSEYTEQKESRMTDEMMILLFDIEKININSVIDEKDIDDLFHNVSDIATIADAEKAFIRLLDTKYNEVKYENYPKSTDGLNGEGLDRYSFSICEQISICTEKAEIRGIYLNDDYRFMDYQDQIMVVGEEAMIVKAKKEYVINI